MFVVYHIKSTMADRRYKREQDARLRVAKLSDTRPGEYAYNTEDAYDRDVVHMVERVNLMSGQKYMEKSNTPNFLSPASEAYWSM